MAGSFVVQLLYGEKKPDSVGTVFLPKYSEVDLKGVWGHPPIKYFIFLKRGHNEFEFKESPLLVLWPGVFAPTLTLFFLHTDP